MYLKAILFDMGGTLETFDTSFEYRVENAPLFRDCLKRAGIELGLNDQELAETISNGVLAYHYWNMKSMIELPASEIWTKFVFDKFGVDKKVINESSEELAYLFERYFYFRELRPEVFEVLESIKNMGLKIGLISNTQSKTQVYRSLTEYGILNYFDTIVLSSEYGRRKPDASIFYHAARLINVPTGSCMYIGDKITRDIIGARRSGFRMAVQIRHDFDDGEKDEGAVPDAIIDDLRELLPLIKKELKKDKLYNDPLEEKAIKAFFFDAGDILYYRPEPSLHLKEFLQNKNITLHPDFQNEKIRLKDLAYSGKLPRHKYHEELLHLYGIVDPEDVAEGLKAISRDENSVAVFEGVPDTINELKKRGYLLGIITDTAMPYTKKLDWFNEHGFGDVWDTVISSKEIGIRKPHPSMYEEAINQTGIRPEQGIFVGHKTSELKGAKEVGLYTVAFNYDKDAQADIYIENFEDLLKVPLLNSSPITQ